VNFGLPDDYYVTYADQVRKATDAQVNAAAKKFVDPSRLTWVVIGDRAKIESGIKELKLGEVMLLDADGRPKSAVP
jgi:zinc protease